MSQSLDSITPVNWAPLKPGEDFRVIALNARSTGEALTATLKCVSFEALFNKYLAISYRWGDGSLNETITCNGYTVRISKNLYSALWRLRQPTQATNIWCDALCIKQGTDAASLLERDQQVPLMGCIYGSAVRVMIDLGDEDGTLSKVVEGINAIVSTPQDLRKRVQFEADPAKYLSLPPFTDPMWDALETFLSRPWFRCLWCVQEAVLARDIRVMFGSHFMTLEQLVSTASVYALVSSKAIRTLQVRTWSMSKFNTPGLATMSLLATWHMRQARLARAENYAVSLCQLMMSTMGQHTTDQRDRVYALYGMLGPQAPADLPVNYAESTAELGVRLSKFFVRNKNGIWMLPSWTVDLSMLGARQIYDTLYAQTEPDGTNAMYSAGQGTKAAELKLHSLPGCLEVQGVIADVVKYTPAMYTLPADALLGESEQRMTPAVMLKYIKWLASIVQWAEQVSDTTTPSDAFWRTLIANFDPHQDDPEREHSGHPKAGFRDYFDLLVAYVRRISNLNLDPDLLTEDDFEAEYGVPPGAVKYWVAAIVPLMKRRVVQRRSGRFGLVPEACKIDDVIAVFHGVPVPSKTHKDDATDRFRVVGISYVHGLMDGEAFQENVLPRTFCLR